MRVNRAEEARKYYESILLVRRQQALTNMDDVHVPQILIPRRGTFDQVCSSDDESSNPSVPVTIRRGRSAMSSSSNRTPIEDESQSRRQRQ